MQLFRNGDYGAKAPSDGGYICHRQTAPDGDAPPARDSFGRENGNRNRRRSKSSRSLSLRRGARSTRNERILSAGTSMASHLSQRLHICKYFPFSPSIFFRSQMNPNLHACARPFHVRFFVAMGGHAPSCLSIALLAFTDRPAQRAVRCLGLASRPSRDGDLRVFFFSISQCDHKRIKFLTPVLVFVRHPLSYMTLTCKCCYCRNETIRV